MKFITILTKIKYWAATLGVPIILAIGYQLHLQRVESLKDQINFLNDIVNEIREKEEITRYDNALNLIKSQKELYKLEILELEHKSNIYKNNNILLTKEISSISAKIKRLEIDKKSNKEFKKNIIFKLYNLQKKREILRQTQEKNHKLMLKALSLIYVNRAKELGCDPLFTIHDIERLKDEARSKSYSIVADELYQLIEVE